LNRCLRFGIELISFRCHLQIYEGLERLKHRS